MGSEGGAKASTRACRPPLTMRRQPRSSLQAVFRFAHRGSSLTNGEPIVHGACGLAQRVGAGFWPGERGQTSRVLESDDGYAVVSKGCLPLSGCAPFLGGVHETSVSRTLDRRGFGFGGDWDRGRFTGRDSRWIRFAGDAASGRRRRSGTTLCGSCGSSATCACGFSSEKMRVRHSRQASRLDEVSALTRRVWKRVWLGGGSLSTPSHRGGSTSVDR